MLAGVVFAVGALILASPWLSGRVTIPYDAKAEFFPQFAFLARALHAGQSPFWTPNIFDGSPQIADPQSLIFSPAFLLAALLTPTPGFVLADAVVFVSLVAGGGVIILYFRDRDWHAAGAVVAALAFAFGGSAAWRIQHVGQILSLAWLPVVLFCLSRAIERASLLWGVIAGLSGAFLLLGRDQVALLEIYVLSAFAVVMILRQPLRRAVAPVAAGFVAGTLVAFVPLMLTLAFALQSNRPEIGLADAQIGSLHPASLLTLVSADIFGVAGPLEKFWGPPSPGWGETGLYIARNMGALYMGVAVILAVATAVIARPGAWWRDVHARFLAAATIVVALFAFGKYTPVFAWLYDMPGVALFRRPADAAFVLCGLTAILGGYSVHVLTKTRTPPVLAGILVIIALALCIGTAVAKDRLLQAIPAIAVTAAFLVASAALLMHLPRLAPAAAIACVGALMTADLAIGNAPNESTGLPPDTFDMLRAETHDATIRTLRARLQANAAPDRRDRIELAGLGFVWPNASLVQDFDNHLGYNPLRLALFEDFTGAGDHVALPEQRVFSKAFPSYRSVAADLCGLRFIATGVPVAQIDPLLREGDLTLIARTPDAYIYENPHALPRVLLATRAVSNDFTKLLRDGAWPVVDYATTVLLQAPVEADAPRRPGQAKIVSYANTDIVVEANAPDGGWLVLNDVWHPWWRAEIDGTPAEILRANGMFRAVALKPGDHVVRFTFQPLVGLLAQARDAFLDHTGSVRRP